MVVSLGLLEEHGEVGREQLLVLLEELAGVGDAVGQLVGIALGVDLILSGIVFWDCNSRTS
jgi:hypothetical protein